MASIFKRSWNLAKSTKNPLLARAAIGLRNISYGDITYVQTNELVRDTLDWIKTFPQRYDMVVGIPRAGMIPATLIATQLGLPLTMPDLFPRAFISKQTYNVVPKSVLIVDDASGHGEGGTVDEILKRLQAIAPSTRFWKASTYVMESCKDYFDLHYRVIKEKGRFICEWNIQHDKYFGVTASDLDGVLSEDCPDDVDDDEVRYVRHLTSARPYFMPDYEIDYILTARLEKYRPATEAWLAKNAIKYKELIMWNLDDKSKRKNPGEFKASELLRIKPGIFIESDHQDAELIWRKIGIHVFCFQHMNFVGRCQV